MVLYVQCPVFPFSLFYFRQLMYDTTCSPRALAMTEKRGSLTYFIHSLKVIKPCSRALFTKPPYCSPTQAVSIPNKQVLLYTYMYYLKATESKMLPGVSQSPHFPAIPSLSLKPTLLSQHLVLSACFHLKIDRDNIIDKNNYNTIIKFFSFHNSNSCDQGKKETYLFVQISQEPRSSLAPHLDILLLTENYNMETKKQYKQNKP